MNKTTWPQAAVILGVLAVVVTLAILGRDLAAVAALGAALFAALGVNVAQVIQVRDQTNGATSQLVALVAELAHRAYDSIPPAALGPPGPAGTASVTDPLTSDRPRLSTDPAVIGAVKSVRVYEGHGDPVGSS